jgi:hypothetical protein
MVDFTTTIDTPTNGQQQARCRLLYAVLSAWPLGEHQIEVSIRSSAPLDTGWEQFPNGLFSKRVYQVMVTRRMFEVK